MAQTVASIVAESKVFHGLVKAYFAPGVLSPTNRALAPTTNWSVEGGEVTMRQATYLSGATAMAAATVDAVLGGTFLARTTIGIQVMGILINGARKSVFVEADLQSGEALADVVDDLSANFDIAVAGVGSATNGRVYTRDGDSIAAIGTGMALKYAASSGAAPTITLTSAAVNTGNDYDVIFYHKPAPPTIVTLESGAPLFAGCQEYALINEGGVTLGFEGTQNFINAVQSFEPVTDYISSSVSNISFGMLQNRDVEALQLISGLVQVASTDNYDVILPNFGRTQQRFTFALVVDSLDVDGQKDIVVAYSVAGLNFSTVYDRIHQAIQGTFVPRAVTGGDEKIYVAQYRPSAA